MANAQYRDCPGCDLRLPMSDAFLDERYNASPECFHLYGELTGYTVMRGDETFIHQHLVDTYAAQHAADAQRPISCAFALIGLYLAFEKGYTGRQVQRMHMLLARRSKRWPAFARPAQAGALTVLDVLNAPPGQERDEMLMRWGRSVWEAWSHAREPIQALIASVMQD